MAGNPNVVPIAYINNTPAVPPWLNKGDNAWQLTAATLVGLQSVPGLIILYGSIVKKKWAVNSAFMALYAFAAVIICWVTWAYKMSFGEKLLPFWGRAGPALDEKFLLSQARLNATKHNEIEPEPIFFPAAAMVWYQGMFAAITVILLAGSLLGRMNIRAWMMFVPLWLTFSYTVGAFSLWGGGFLFQWGVMDYSGGYVIHVSSGIAGLTAAYWGQIILKGHVDQGLYHLPPASNSPPRVYISERTSVGGWHQRLAHPHLAIVKRIIQDYGLPVSSTKFPFVCEPCNSKESSHPPPF